MNLRKLSFSKFQVLSYIEEKMMNDEATKYEEELYITYKYDNKLNKFTYNKVIKTMKQEYLGGINNG